MGALRKRGRDGQGKSARPALYGIRRIAGWAIGVATIVALVTLMTISTSEACADRESQPRLVTQSDLSRIVQTVANSAQSSLTSGHSQSATARTVIRKSVQTAAASGIVNVAQKPCCGDSFSRCHSSMTAGSCCSACSAGLYVAGESNTSLSDSHFFVVVLEVPLLSSQSDSQFRPPRTAL